MFSALMQCRSVLWLNKREVALESSKSVTESGGEPANMTGVKTPQPNSESNALQSVENLRKKSWQMERTAGIETGRETLIEIDKDGKGLGLSIVGGSDTVLGTVVIHEVYPDGAAAMDGRLKPGDQVLEVNGVSLRGVSHEHAISLLRRTPAKVRLLVYRDVNLQLSLLDPTQIYNIFEMELTKKPGRGLGLSIVGRKNEPGVYVSEVVKGGAAEADARLMQGDQILAVNGQDVTNSMQEDVAAMLKTCTGRVALRVGRWKLTETANRVHAAAEAAYASERAAAISPNGTLATVASNSQLHTPNAESSYSSLTPEDDKKMVPPPAPPSRPSAVPQVTVEEDNHSPKVIHSDLSPVTEEPSSGADQKSLAAEDESSSTVTSQSKEIELIKELYEENSDSLLIQLKKVPDQQLGMGIGKRTRGILVTSLQPGSVAAEKLRVGDRLMAVNGLPVTDQLSAVTLVKASGERLYLQIARPRNLPTA
ncbi:Multiple PDZ domain protein [Toxocara canis]|uniref:Multiple PDZ domain protein n=1 Tax=Toxocara canis TaxID=6265 RepID=A0A0B2VS06_TOXCA|nr:Multiple PDZ domain protein [Toxocara canis]